jgi:branched-chain amino acid transport system permease protein
VEAGAVGTPDVVVRERPSLRGNWGRTALVALLVVVVGWIAYKALEDLKLFTLVTINGLTLAGLYFIVASGFTLIFGLMRVVNMAHGSFFMLGGVFAFLLQERMLGDDASSGFGPDEVTVLEWVVPLVVGTLAIAAIGLATQQILLRWNQGQELRQALITIALSIIIADQTVARFGGISEEITPPSAFPETINLGIYDIQYSFMRFITLAVAIVVGVGLYLLIMRTRFGMIVRAGVDDRQMVSALGINIQIVFALAFLLGAGLAGLAGVLGGTTISVDKSNDSAYLLFSLIVVIIGGMGSLVGAAIGAVLLGLVDSYGDVYLPSGYENYSPVLIFALLVIVLAARPLGLFGRPA